MRKKLCMRMGIVMMGLALMGFSGCGKTTDKSDAVESVSETESETKTESESESETETESESETETETETLIESESESESETENITETEEVTEPETVIETETEIETAPETQPETELYNPPIDPVSISAVFVADPEYGEYDKPLVGTPIGAENFIVSVSMSDGSVCTNPSGWTAEPLYLGDVNNTITISYHGVSTTIDVECQEIKRGAAAATFPCSVCEQAGVVDCPDCDAASQAECATCGGSGCITCTNCGGSGLVGM